MNRIVAIVAAASLALTGCVDSGVVNGHTYSAYGLANEDANHNPTIHYHVSILNVIMGVIFCESIIVPIVVVGWQLFVPDGPNHDQDPSKKGLES